MYSKFVIFAVLCYLNSVFCNNITEVITSYNSLKFSTGLNIGLIERLFPTDILGCVRSCLRYSRCKSFNYNHGYLLCELNSRNSTTNPEKLRKVGEYIYGDIIHWNKEQILTDDPCESVTCPELYRCEPSSTAQPPCVITECGDPVLPNLFTSSGDGTGIRRSQKLSCKDGYSLAGSGNDNIVCQTSGIWTSIQSTCEKDCGVPPAVANARYTDGDKRYGSNITYTCNTGYVMDGSSSVTCKSGGVWSDVSFTCEECPSHSFVYKSATIMKRCYWLTFTLKTWNESNTECTTDGGTLAIIDSYHQNTALVQYIRRYYDQSIEKYIWLGFSDQVTDNQFLKPNGEPQTYFNWAGANPTTNLECGSINTKYTNWHDLPCHTSRQAICSKTITIDCGTPPFVRGARVTGSGTVPGSTRTYSCDSGYEYSSPQTITCDGVIESWSPLTFVCNDCTNGLGTTYVHVPSRYFTLPGASFTPSLVGSMIDVASCKSHCISRQDFVCVVFYMSKTGGHCVMWGTRVSDNAIYWDSYDWNSSVYDEYTRECARLETDD